MHPFVDEVGDPMGQHPGLSRAGAGDDEQRTLVVDDGVELIGVQPLDERRRTPGPGCLRLEVVAGRRLGCGFGRMRDVGEQLLIGHDPTHSRDGVSQPKRVAGWV